MCSWQTGICRRICAGDFAEGEGRKGNMIHKIGLLADVHGNTTALKAVIEDAMLENVTEYWLLGDLMMPGPGSANLFNILKSLNVSVFVKGNWEDCFLDVLAGDVDIDDPTDIYIYLKKPEIEFIQRLPLSMIKHVNGLNIGVSHNLPDKNFGGDLAPDQNQKNFDRLFAGNHCDIAVYAHVHHQMMRYSSEDQLIINPGSIGQPFSKWSKHCSDLRAQYAIIEIDEKGLLQIKFKKIEYDRNEEIQEAKRKCIPYFDLYKELLETGHTHTHDKELLKETNRYYDYKEEVIHFLNGNTTKR